MPPEDDPPNAPKHAGEQADDHLDPASGTWTGADEATKVSAESLITWVDNVEPSRQVTIGLNPQQAHHNKMQARLLFGLGLVFLFTVAAVIAGPAFRWVSEDFARQLAQMILPALLASAGTVFGFFFKSSG